MENKQYFPKRVKEEIEREIRKYFEINETKPQDTKI
jgi:hypothetical protein